MKKKISITIGLMLILTIVSGCEKENTIATPNNNNKSGVIHCTRAATAEEGVDVDLNYEVTYKGDYVQIVHSIEKITTTKEETLDTYEKAYRDIFKHYEGLKYYDNTVTRTQNSVTSNTTINYEKIDTEKLLEIEGEEDNVIENGKVKLKTWLDFTKKYGTKCDEESSS